MNRIIFSIILFCLLFKSHASLDGGSPCPPLKITLIEPNPAEPCPTDHSTISSDETRGEHMGLIHDSSLDLSANDFEQCANTDTDQERDAHVDEQHDRSLDRAESSSDSSSQAEESFDSDSLVTPRPTAIPSVAFSPHLSATLWKNKPKKCIRKSSRSDSHMARPTIATRKHTIEVSNNQSIKPPSSPLAKKNESCTSPVPNKPPLPPKPPPPALQQEEDSSSSESDSSIPSELDHAPPARETTINPQPIVPSVQPVYIVQYNSPDYALIFSAGLMAGALFVALICGALYFYKKQKKLSPSSGYHSSSTHK